MGSGCFCLGFYIQSGLQSTNACFLSIHQHIRPTLARKIHWICWALSWGWAPWPGRTRRPCKRVRCCRAMSLCVVLGVMPGCSNAVLSGLPQPPHHRPQITVNLLSQQHVVQASGCLGYSISHAHQQNRSCTRISTSGRSLLQVELRARGESQVSAYLSTWYLLSAAAVKAVSAHAPGPFAFRFDGQRLGSVWELLRSLKVESLMQPCEVKQVASQIEAAVRCGYALLTSPAHLGHLRAVVCRLLLRAGIAGLSSAAISNLQSACGVQLQAAAAPPPPAAAAAAAAVGAPAEAAVGAAAEAAVGAAERAAAAAAAAADAEQHQEGSRMADRAAREDDAAAEELGHKAAEQAAEQPSRLLMPLRQTVQRCPWLQMVPPSEDGVQFRPLSRDPGWQTKVGLVAISHAQISADEAVKLKPNDPWLKAQAAERAAQVEWVHCGALRKEARSTLALGRVMRTARAVAGGVVSRDSSNDAGSAAPAGESASSAAAAPAVPAPPPAVAAAAAGPSGTEVWLQQGMRKEADLLGDTARALQLCVDRAACERAAAFGLCYDKSIPVRDVPDPVHIRSDIYAGPSLEDLGRLFAANEAASLIIATPTDDAVRLVMQAERVRHFSELLQGIFTDTKKPDGCGWWG